MRVTLTWLGYPQDPHGNRLTVQQFKRLPRAQKDTLLETMNKKFPDVFAQYSGVETAAEEEAGDGETDEPSEGSESSTVTTKPKKPGRPRKNS